MARFFYFVGRSDEEAAVIDRFAARYGWTVSEILEMDAARLYELDKKVREADRRKEAREQWLAMLPLMSVKMLKFMSFEDYLGQVTGQNIDLRPDAEILAEVEQVRKELAGGSV